MDANTLTAIEFLVGALVANVPTWIITYKGLRQGQANGDKADQASVKVDAAALKLDHATLNAETAAALTKDNLAKTDQVLAGTEKIHELVNSGSDKMKLEIAALKAELVIANARTDKLAMTIDDLLHRAVGLAAPSAEPVQVEVMNTPLVVTQT